MGVGGGGEKKAQAPWTLKKLLQQRAELGRQITSSRRGLSPTSRYSHYLLSLLAPSQALVCRSLPHWAQSPTTGAGRKAVLPAAPAPPPAPAAAAPAASLPCVQGGAGLEHPSGGEGLLKRLGWKGSNPGTCMNSKGSGPQPADYHILPRVELMGIPFPPLSLLPSFYSPQCRGVCPSGT